MRDTTGEESGIVLAKTVMETAIMLLKEIIIFVILYNINKKGLFTAYLALWVAYGIIYLFDYMQKEEAKK